MLFIFGGLPGVGKSELAAHIAKKFSAVYLRIDTLEQAMRNAGYTLRRDEGYQVAYALAADNLELGNHVVADSVNPIAITRNAWRAVARNLGAPFCEIEIVCSDPREHQNRVETRKIKIPGLTLPTWEEVINRRYEKWDGTIVMDTAGKTLPESKSRLEEALAKIPFRKD